MTDILWLLLENETLSAAQIDPKTLKPLEKEEVYNDEEYIGELILQ